jgi:O-antigen biosynthesis protein
VSQSPDGVGDPTGKIYDSHGPLVSTHLMVLSQVPRGGRVLELGCATGYMTRYMNEELGCRVTAVEISPAMAEKAEQFAEKMIVGNAEDRELWERIGAGFDCAVFADVLEHFADPWDVLRRTRQSLAPGGIVLASIPNVVYYKNRKQVLLGRFDYTDYGILDSTHLRFFTKKSILELFSDCGYDTCGVLPSFRGRTDRWLSRLCPSAFAYQYVVCATPSKP